MLYDVDRTCIYVFEVSKMNLGGLIGGGTTQVFLVVPKLILINCMFNWLYDSIIVCVFV